MGICQLFFECPRQLQRLPQRVYITIIFKTPGNSAVETLPGVCPLAVLGIFKGSLLFLVKLFSWFLDGQLNLREQYAMNGDRDREVRPRANVQWLKDFTVSKPLPTPSSSFLFTMIFILLFKVNFKCYQLYQVFSNREN